MLNAADRDWLQEQVLKVRTSWDRGSNWHRQKGLVLYLLGGFGLAAVGGIFFGNREIGLFGSSLCVMICLALGGYYYYRGQEERRTSDERRRIEEVLERRGIKLSYDGRKVSDGLAWVDPMLGSSYEEVGR